MTFPSGHGHTNGQTEQPTYPSPAHWQAHTSRASSAHGIDTRPPARGSGRHRHHRVTRAHFCRQLGQKPQHWYITSAPRYRAVPARARAGAYPRALSLQETSRHPASAILRPACLDEAAHGRARVATVRPRDYSLPDRVDAPCPSLRNAPTPTSRGLDTSPCHIRSPVGQSNEMRPSKNSVHIFESTHLEFENRI
ncbi:hypothetical protein WOLCODRAFT_160364 [Wolfiporia cocos MD-104 SS10]|uniref:Uncharacterized protein n=1 Tax=Wolfiporia cocos (strain MD-104) TaxID=742152 RepID=A0A2H3J840_WOLCO|nr:hypothetical protein WOLCODRAFT_160364 [Wolfiporia cocos MD-104 SS10]